MDLYARHILKEIEAVDSALSIIDIRFGERSFLAGVGEEGSSRAC